MKGKRVRIKNKESAFHMRVGTITDVAATCAGDLNTVAFDNGESDRFWDYEVFVLNPDRIMPLSTNRFGISRRDHSYIAYDDQIWRPLLPLFLHRFVGGLCGLYLLKRWG